jgi:hypothetical protein
MSGAITSSAALSAVCWSWAFLRGPKNSLTVIHTDVSLLVFARKPRGEKMPGVACTPSLHHKNPPQAEALLQSESGLARMISRRPQGSNQ